MKLRKVLTLLLAVLFVVGMIAACTPAAKDEKVNDEPEKQEEKAPEAEVEPEVEPEGEGEDAPATTDKEPITLTSGGDYSADGVRDSVVTNALTEITGVTVQQIVYDAEKMKVLAAGGDLPDMPKLYTCDDMAVFLRNLIDEGMIIQLDDLIAEYGQDLLACGPDALNYANNVFNNGNGTYFSPKACVYPLTTPNKNGGDAGFMVRWDVYKALGAPELNGEDDFIQLLADGMEAYPTAPNGNKVWGISWFEDWGYYWPANSWATHYKNGSGSQTILDVETHELLDGWLDPHSDFWNSKFFFNKAYRAGVFDPDGLAMNWTQYSEKSNNGELLTSQANYMMPDREVVGDPNAICVYAKGMSEYITYVYNNESPLGWTISNGWCISSNCQYPERAMQWFNYLASDEGYRVHYNGVKGVDWDIVDGVPKMLGKRLDYVLSGGVENADYMENFGGGAFGLFGPPRQPHSKAVNDDYPYDLSYSYEYVLAGLNEGEKDYVAFMCEREGWSPDEVRTPGEVYVKWCEEGSMKAKESKAWLGHSFMPNASEEMQAIYNQCNTYLGENTATFILANSEEEFYAAVDAAIEQLKAFGAETWIEDYKARAEESLKVYASMGLE